MKPKPIYQQRALTSHIIIPGRKTKQKKTFGCCPKFIQIFQTRCKNTAPPVTPQ